MECNSLCVGSASRINETHRNLVWPSSTADTIREQKENTAARRKSSGRALVLLAFQLCVSDGMTQRPNPETSPQFLFHQRGLHAAAVADTTAARINHHLCLIDRRLQVTQE